MRLRVMLTIAALLLAAGSASATIHEIQVGNFFFSPTKTVVQPGDTVRWILVSGVHTTQSDAGSAKTWNSGTLSGSYDLVFTAGDGPGPFPYLCGVHPLTMKDTIFMAPAAEPTRYVFALDERDANDCNGTGSSARGYGMAILSPDSSELSLYVVHDIASPLDGHVHTGAPCVSGPVAFGFTSPASPISETWALTPTDLTNLINGDLYVNIHTNDNPSGEIRGQIVQSDLRLLYNLDEAQANMGAGTGSFASGFGVATLNATADTLSMTITHDVADPIDAHIHLGAPGVSGAVQFPFASPNSPITGDWALDTTDIKNLLDGNLYANVHSTPNPSGEIRGQLRREPARFVFGLTESEADMGNGTGSAATGFAVCELNADQDSMTIAVDHDVAGVLDGHVHLGAPGVSGPVQFGFTSPTSPISETWEMTEADVDNLLAGDLYINIHSNAFPAGEIRGQLDQGAIGVTFALDEAQADECNGTGSAATGTATVNLKGEAMTMTVAISHDVADPIDAHIHLGAACVSGPIQFQTDFTSPANNVWYLSMADVTNYLREELYLNIHSTPFPGGEIRGQLAEPSGCCSGGTGNVNNDPMDQKNLSDLTVLVNALFVTFDPLPCPAEANTSGDAACNISLTDVTALVNHLFVTFQAIADCADFDEANCD